MQIYVWSDFKKKTNSTKRPTNGTLIEGYYRNSDPLSLLTPVIRIEANTTTPTWNYCYIPDFGRYYYIAEWTHEEGVWIAQLSCDVLASYKDEIGNQDMYVLRSSENWDDRIVDTKYPTKVKRTITTSEVRNVILTTPANPTSMVIDPDVFKKDFSDGSYIMGIYGPEGSGVTYYSLSYQTFIDFTNELMTWDITDENGWDLGALGKLPKQYAKTVADPLQFIESCTWIPFSQEEYLKPGVTPIGQIKLGYYSKGITGQIHKLDLDDEMIKCQMYFPIPKHPQASDRGQWLQTSPYSQYTLVLHPFGEFEISGAELIDKANINATWYIDYITCVAMLYLYADNVFLGCSESTFGVPVKLNQVNIDVRGMVEGAATGVVGAAKAIGGVGKTIVGAATGLKAIATPMSLEQMAKRTAPSSGAGSMIGGGLSDIASGAAQSVGGFADAYEAAQPKIKSKGGVGTYLPFGAGVFPRLIGEFAEIVDEFNRDLGRPLCRVRKPKDIPGYIIAENGYIDTVGTAAETDKVAQYVCGGFFYE